MLVGRRSEESQLLGLLDGARAGLSSALIVHGEPGIGKTSLLERAAANAGEFALLRVQPLEVEAELPFAGLSDLVRPILPLLDRIPEPQRAALAGALALGPPASGDRYAVAAATLSLLAAAGEEAPVLAVVDDAHWLDKPSRDALLFAGRRLGSEGVVLLLGMRDRDWLQTAGVAALELRGLAPADAAALVDATGAAVDEAVRQRLVAQTGGNPLALLEAVSTLSKAELSGAAPIEQPLPVGAALERAFAQQLHGFPAETRSALLIAAASETGAAHEIVRALDAAGIGRPALDPAERDGVVSLSGERVEFRHPLVRSAAYHVADNADRRAAHRALAAALEGESTERAAWHHAAAATGPDEHVAAMLEHAAETALARSAYSAAAHAFEAAAGLSPAGTDRLRRTMGAGRALWLGGEAVRAASLLDGVASLAVDPITRAELQQLRGTAMLFTRPIPETFALLVGEAERVQAHDPARAAAMLTNAALSSFMAADVRRAEETARRAAAVAAREPGPVLMFATLTLALALANEGRVDEALPLIEPILDHRELFETVGEFTLAVAGICEGFVWLDRWYEARWTLETMVAAARAAGAPTVLPFPLAALSELELRQGRVAAAYAAAAESVQLAAETGQIVEATYSLVTLARVEAVRGDDEDCRAHVAAALDACRLTGAASIEDYSAATLGLLELGLGHAADALTHLASCEAFQVDHGVGLPTVVPFAADLVEAYARCGRVEDAARSLGDLEERASRSGVRSALATVARCRGILAGEDEYEAPFAHALELHGDDTLFDRARTQLWLGMRRRRSRRRAAARAALRDALAYFEAAGAEPWAEQARAELRATGHTPVPARDGSLRELTPQELQVALIVAKGATNKETATALFLSPKTVEFHLGNAYRKLGIRSRAELVRKVEGLP